MADHAQLLGYEHRDFVEPFVLGAGGRMVTQQELLENHTNPMVASGITKTIVPELARQRSLDWYYIDTGYIGNHEYKKYFRVTKNARQRTGDIVPYDDTRLRSLKLDRTQYSRGNRVVLVPPDKKVAHAYRIGSADAWTESTLQKIQSFTQRPVVVRQRPPSREVRQGSDRFDQLLRDDVNAVVVYSSNCAVEAVMHGIPVVVLGENSTQPLAQPLEKIDALDDLDQDQLESFLRHLSYSQFTLKEMRSGYAWRMVKQ
jgi:hypothetical protein